MTPCVCAVCESAEAMNMAVIAAQEAAEQQKLADEAAAMDLQQDAPGA